METHMLTRKTRLVLATLTGGLIAMACGGGNGYSTTAPTPPPPAGNMVAATASLTSTAMVSAAGLTGEDYTGLESVRTPGFGRRAPPANAARLPSDGPQGSL